MWVGDGLLCSLFDLSFVPPALRRSGGLDSSGAAVVWGLNSPVSGFRAIWGALLVEFSSRAFDDSSRFVNTQELVLGEAFVREIPLKLSTKAFRVGLRGMMNSS